MKLATEQREVTIAGGESNPFTIKANAKAFHVLISGLYSNKIQSITREIWSNAFDSHCMAGKKEVPFDVVLPTTLNPTFSVRDYGIGLAHHDVMKLYTIVFESLKEDTNDQIGKWGLGSKSPFSYTDTFSVTSWFNGTKSYYTAVIDQGGIPTINLMGQEQTTEPNGLEVSFSVAPRDVYTFVSEADRVSLGFDVKPNVTNKSHTWPVFETKVQGENYQTYSTNTWNMHGAHVRMGCVLYKVDYSQFMDLNPEERAILGSEIILNVPIGSVEVTASRESLSYGRNEPTVATLKHCIRKVVGEIQEDLKKSVAKAETLHEACKLMHQQPGVPTSLRLGSYKWGSTLINRNFTKNYDFYSSGATYARQRKTISFNSSRDVALFFDYAGIVVQKITRGKRDVRPNKRLYKWLEDKDGTYLWVQLDENLRDHMQDFQQLLEDMGDIPVHFVADMEDPGSIQGTRSKVRIRDRYMNPIEVDSSEFDEEHVFIKMENNEPHISNAGKIVQLLCNHACYYYVPKTLWKRVEKETEWLDLEEVLVQWADDNKNLIDRWVPFSYDNPMPFSKFSFKDKRLQDLYSGLKRNNPEVKGLTEVDVNHLVSVVDPKFSEKLRDREAKNHQNREDITEIVRKEYPLVGYNNSYGSTLVSELQEYIDYKEAKKGLK